MIKTNESKREHTYQLILAPPQLQERTRPFSKDRNCLPPSSSPTPKTHKNKNQKQRIPNSRPSPKANKSFEISETNVCAARTRWVLAGWSSPGLTSLLSLLRRSKEGRERKKEAQAQAQGDVKANVFFNFPHSPLCFLLFLGDGIPYGSLGNNLKVDANEIRPGRQVGLGKCLFWGIWVLYWWRGGWGWVCVIQTRKESAVGERWNTIHKWTRQRWVGCPLGHTQCMMLCFLIGAFTS